MKTISLRDLAFIAVKLFAVYLIITILAPLASSLFSIVHISQTTSSSSQPVIFNLLGLGFPLISIIMAIILWFGADKIARYMTKSSASKTEITDETNDLLSILLIAMGIYLLIITTSQLLGLSFALLMAEISNNSLLNMTFTQHTPRFIVLFTQLCFSLILIFGAKRFSATLVDNQSAESRPMRY